MRRYLIFIIGLFINSTGVCLITKADLGTSPTSAIPYTLSLGFPLSMGTFTIAFNLLLIVLQIILYRKEFEKSNIFRLRQQWCLAIFLTSYCGGCRG